RLLVRSEGSRDLTSDAGNHTNSGSLTDFTKYRTWKRCRRITLPCWRNEVEPYGFPDFRHRLPALQPGKTFGINPPYVGEPHRHLQTIDADCNPPRRRNVRNETLPTW